VRSGIHLQVLDSLVIRNKLHEISEVSGVKNIVAVKSGETRSDAVHMVYNKRSNRVLYLIESEKPLSEGTSKKLGLGLLKEIEEPTQAKVSFRLTLAGQHRGARWEPNVKELLDEVQIPGDIGEDWRKTFDQYAKERKLATQELYQEQGVKGWIKQEASSLKEHTFRSQFNEIKIEAFVTGSGAEIPLGTIAEGKVAAKMMGLGKTRWLKAKLRDMSYLEPASPHIKIMQQHATDGGPRDRAGTCERSALARFLGRVHPLEPEGEEMDDLN
jgi:hypothetical protein